VIGIVKLKGFFPSVARLSFGVSGDGGVGLAFKAPCPTPSPSEAAEVSVADNTGCQVSFSSLLSVFLVRVLRMDSPRSSMR
jgi:hypothetical protein